MKSKIIILIFILISALHVWAKSVTRAQFGTGAYESLIEKYYYTKSEAKGQFRQRTDFVSYYYKQIEDNTNYIHNIMIQELISQLMIGIPNIVVFDTELYLDYKRGNIQNVLDNGINTRMAFAVKTNIAVNYVTMSIIPFRNFLSVIRIGKLWLNYGDTFLYRSWGRQGIMVSGPKSFHFSYNLFYTLDNYKNFFDIKTKKIEKNGNVVMGGKVDVALNWYQRGTARFIKFSSYTNNNRKLDGYMAGIVLNNYIGPFVAKQIYSYASRKFIDNSEKKGLYCDVSLLSHTVLFKTLGLGANYCEKGFAVRDSDTGYFVAPTYLADWYNEENRELAIDAYGFYAKSEIVTPNQVYFDFSINKSFNLSGNPDINSWAWESGIREKTDYNIGVSYYYLTDATFEIYFDYMIKKYKLNSGYFNGRHLEILPRFTFNILDNLLLQIGINSMMNVDQKFTTELSKQFFLGAVFTYKNLLLKSEFVYRQLNTKPQWIDAPLWSEGPWWNYDMEYGGWGGLDNYFRIFLKISI